MFALLLTAFVFQSDDPILVDNDVTIVDSKRFKMPLEIPQEDRDELATIKTYVSRDQGKTWIVYGNLKPNTTEVVYQTINEGTVWFAVQYIYKNGRIEPNDLKELIPLQKVYVNLNHQSVLHQSQSNDEIKVLKQTVDALKRRIAVLEAALPVRSNLSASLQSQIINFERDYGIQLVFDNPGFPVRGLGGSLVDGRPEASYLIEEYLPLFIEEWRHYPPSLIRKVRIKQIVFCGNLECVQLLAQEKEAAAGLADFEHETIFLHAFSDRIDPEKTQSTYFLRATIHHELFHFLDHGIREHISIDRPWGALVYAYADPAWTSLNTPGYKYGTLSWGNDSCNVTNRFPGFITLYAQRDMSEDKAETYSHMMLNLHEMECRAKDDEILAKKMARIKKDLEAFSPEFNEAFWNKIRYLDRPRLTLKGKEDPWADAHPTLPPLPKPTEVISNEKPEILLVPEPSKRGLIFHRRGCRQ